MSLPVVIYNDRFLDAISWFMQVGGISLFPFIILREKYPGITSGTFLHSLCTGVYSEIHHLP